MIEYVSKRCHEIAEEFGYELDVPIEINSRLKSTLGRVKFSRVGKNCIPIKIEFSKELFHYSHDDIEDVIRHEMAHYFVLKDTKINHGHNAIWKSWAIKLGCRPRATIKVNDKQVRNQSEVKYKYLVRCSKCTQIVGRYKRVSKVIKHPSRYRSKCCNEKIVVNEG